MNNKELEREWLERALIGLYEEVMKEQATIEQMRVAIRILCVSYRTRTPSRNP